MCSLLVVENKKRLAVVCNQSSFFSMFLFIDITNVALEGSSLGTSFNNTCSSLPGPTS